MQGNWGKNEQEIMVWAFTEINRHESRNWGNHFTESTSDNWQNLPYQ